MSSDHQGSAIEAAVVRVPAEREEVQALPTELMQSFFRLLGFRERVFVSHVSRAWRAVALNDRFLWTEAPSPHTGCRRGSEMLRILLSRSDPLPFSFLWESPLFGAHLPRDTAEVVCSNMHRMQTLYIQHLSSDDKERLFRIPAPLLKTFRSEDKDDSPVRAELWPILEDMRIASLGYNLEPQPFAAVRVFSCSDLCLFVDFNISIFNVFPVLKILRVRQISDEDFDPLLDLPGAMDELSLRARGFFDLDYTPLLRSWRDLCVSRLRLDMSHEAAGVVELFSSTIKGPWRLEVDEPIGGTRAAMCEDGQDRIWIVTCDFCISISREPRLAACFPQLESLTSSIAMLVELHNLDGWSRSLPTLRTITLQNSRWGSMWEFPVPRSTAPVEMPRLESLTLWLDGSGMKQLLETHLPALIPAILERAPHVTIEVELLISLSDCDLRPLAAVAAGVLVQKHRHVPTRLYDPRDEFLY